MRTELSAKENNPTGLNSISPWRVAKVVALPNYFLSVTFIDGVQGFVDMNRLITDKNAGVFAVLHNIEVFKQVGVVNGVVTWSGEIDLAPDAMYDSILANGTWGL